MVSRAFSGQKSFLWSVELSLISITFYGQKNFLWSVELSLVSITFYGQKNFLWSVELSLVSRTKLQRVLKNSTDRTLSLKNEHKKCVQNMQKCARGWQNFTKIRNILPKIVNLCKKNYNPKKIAQLEKVSTDDVTSVTLFLHLWSINFSGQYRFLW